MKRHLLRRVIALLGAAAMSLSTIALSLAADAPARSKQLPHSPPITQETADPPRGSMPEDARQERLVMRHRGDPDVELAAARHYLSLADGAEGRLDDADRHINSVLEREPSNFEALMLAGESASLRDNFRRAALNFRNATLVRPDNREAYLALGGALHRAGDEAGADAAYARFRALSDMPPAQSGKSTK